MIFKSLCPDFCDDTFSIKVGGLTADKQSMLFQASLTNVPCSACFRFFLDFLAGV
jgi:hypothetical protein